MCTDISSGYPQANGQWSRSKSLSLNLIPCAVADPGFHVGGVDLVGGRGLPRRLHFVKFVCQNERIVSFRGARAGYAPLDPPMLWLS